MTIAVQDTSFRKKKLVTAGGRLLDLSRPVVMGILNITPDSFYRDSRVEAAEDAIRQAGRMLEEGAALLDLGAQSTRPGAIPVDAEDEWKRLEPVLKAVRHHFPTALLSVDTYHASVAGRALSEGASILNDISGGSLDAAMAATAARLNAPYVLMHMQGTPSTMQDAPHYDDVVTRVLHFFGERLAHLRASGLRDIILDPGFGFGKTPEHNYALLRQLDLFGLLDCPVMAGLSRKSMIGKVLGTTVEERLNGTTALHAVALLKGVDILRVHDVKAAVEVIKLVTLLES
jgi:dihydropteroate synthase